MNAFQKADREELDEQRGLLGTTRRQLGRPRSSAVEERKREQRRINRILVKAGLALAQAEFDSEDLAPAETRPTVPTWGKAEWQALDALKNAILARQRAWTIRSRQGRSLA